MSKGMQLGGPQVALDLKELPAAAPPIQVVCVHQGYELYGSDRVFVEAVAGFRKALPQAEITVLLPQDGPIVQQLQQSQCKILIGKLWVLRRRHLRTLLLAAPVTFTSRLVDAFGLMRQADILYISTVVVLNFMIAARYHRNAIVHVHEIPGPLLMPFFRGLVRFARARTVFNSNASRRAYGLTQLASSVVHNGYRPSAPPMFSDYDGTRPLNLLMIGRISFAKGQDLLIAAIARLPPKLRARLRVRIVGSTFEDDPFEGTMVERVASLGLADCIAFEPFEPDPTSIYAWSDVLVIPSRVIESFGLVAIEAMAYGKGVIAAAQGGLMEIVVDRQTGWLFPAENVEALEASLVEAITIPSLVRERGRAGSLRFEAQFHNDHAARALSEIIAAAGRRARLGPAA